MLRCFVNVQHFPIHVARPSMSAGSITRKPFASPCCHATIEDFQRKWTLRLQSRTQGFCSRAIGAMMWGNVFSTLCVPWLPFVSIPWVPYVYLCSHPSLGHPRPMKHHYLQALMSCGSAETAVTGRLKPNLNTASNVNFSVFGQWPGLSLGLLKSEMCCVWFSFSF